MKPQNHTMYDSLRLHHLLMHETEMTVANDHVVNTTNLQKISLHNQPNTACMTCSLYTNWTHPSPGSTSHSDNAPICCHGRGRLIIAAPIFITS